MLFFLLWFAYIILAWTFFRWPPHLTSFSLSILTFFCFLFLLLLWIIIFLPLISGNISPATSRHGYAMLSCPIYGVAHPSVHLQVLCRLPALSLAFQGPVLVLLFHLCLCIPVTTGTPRTSASQLITWPTVQSLLSSEQTLAWAVLPQAQ